MNNRNFFDVIVKLMASLVVVFLILPFHEYAHGFVAYKLGDKTAKNSGRLTLNPIEHMDVLGSIGIILFGYGWAKPVPVNPLNFRNPKSGMALTALAGPVSNFLAAFVGCLLWNIIYLFNGTIDTTILSYIKIFFAYYIQVNIGIGVFNLIPVPPLDGSKILAYFLPDTVMYKFYMFQRQLSLILILILFSGILDAPLNFLRVCISTALFWLASIPFGM